MANFKALKLDIDRQKSHTRNPHAVTSYPQFCMSLATITWIYAVCLKENPKGIDSAC